MLILLSGKICKNHTGGAIAANKYLQITCIKSLGNFKITLTGNNISVEVI